MTGRWINSADSHVYEPYELWSAPLGTKWGETVPRFLDPTAGETRRTYFNGEIYLPEDDFVGDSEEMKAKVKRACEDPVFRMACMDEDRTYAELLGPTYTLMTFPLKNHDLARDCFAVYNDWLAEYCGAGPKRLLGAALIHMADVDWAVKELERAAKIGLRCVMINVDTGPGWGSYQERKYDPFWARASEMRFPVVLHISTGQKPDMFTMTGEQSRDIPRAYLDLFGEIGGVLANEFIFGGVFDRFPNLQIVLGEFEASWIPPWLFRMEQLEKDFGPNLELSYPDRPFREYLPRIHIGIIDDPMLDTVTNYIDPNTLIWGSDFPHVRNTYLKSHQVIGDIIGHLDADTVDNITRRKMVELFDIDMSAVDAG